MKLVAGLGNPGPRYADSRHNVGYMVVDELARRWGLDVSRHNTRFDGLVDEGPIASARTLLLKPTTFMNLSGRSVAAAWRYYKLTLDDLLVVHDDLDLPVGRIRVRAEGSAGGQKGMLDVLRHVGTTAVPRLRVGIGKVHKAATVDYVLSTFTPDERETVATAIQQAADAVECWLQRGLTAAMNEFNRRGAGGSGRNEDGPAAQGEPG